MTTHILYEINLLRKANAWVHTSFSLVRLIVAALLSVCFTDAYFRFCPFAVGLFAERFDYWWSVDQLGYIYIYITLE